MVKWSQYREPWQVINRPCVSVLIVVESSYGESPNGYGMKLSLTLEDDMEPLILEIAKIWVDGGGDAEGIDWCWSKVKQAVKEEIESRKSWEAQPEHS